MVIPRSFSRSFESITRSSTAWLSRKVPDCLRSWSTSVVLPWSTCAMMAMLRSLRDMMGAGLRETRHCSMVTGYLLCKRVGGQAGVDVLDHALVARAADRSEAAVEFGLRHEFRQVVKVGQQVRVGAGRGQQLPHPGGVIAGRARAELHAGAIVGQVGETEAGPPVGVFLFLHQADGVGEAAATVGRQR